MYDEIVPFFGTEKAKLFVALNYTDGDNYSHALNEGNAEALLDEPLWQLMSAKNYANGGRAGWQAALAPHTEPKPLELAGQFIDFIGSIARHHARIDGVVAIIPAGTRRGAVPMDVQKGVNVQPGALIGGPALNASPQSDDLYRQIYTNWERLDESTRQFYSQHLNILDALGNVVAQQTPGQKARLNLLKVDPANNMSALKFEQTLPLLPAGAFFVNGAGREVQLNADAVRGEYQQVYRGAGGIAGALQYGGDISQYFKHWAATGPGYVAPAGGPAANPNGLDVPKFTAALVYATNKKLKARASGDVKSDFPHVFDLVTGNLYSVGPNGELKKGDKVVDAASYAADIAAGNVHCFGTNLADCDKVYECLLSGDPKKLGRCLGKLRKADMKLVAGTELKSIRPEVALELLKTFNIELRKDTYGNRVPMEFLEWRATLDARVGAAAASAIKENKQLLDYLRAVVELVRANPEIIAENRQRAVEMKQALSNAGVVVNKPRPFIAPSKRAAPASTMLLRTIPYVTSQLSLPTPPLLPPGIAGFGYGPALSFPFGFMRGGADKNELTDLASVLKKNYDAVLKDLQDSGKDLVDSDKNLIENAIKKVSKNQKDIEHLLNELRAFNRLSAGLKAGLPQTLGVEDVEGASRMVNLDRTVDNLQSNVGSIARENQALITQLYNNVFKSLASLRLGVSSSNLVPASH